VPTSREEGRDVGMRKGKGGREWEGRLLFDLVELESIPHTSSIIPTRFEVDMTINCRVIAFLSADTSRYLVTFALLTLNS